jgi:arylsulfatase A-like enzyme
MKTQWKLPVGVMAFVVLAGWGAAAQTLAAAEVRGALVKPNFIVIMVDDMGHAGVGCFGNPYFKTPEIDRLAAEGIRLTDFHSSGAVCSPTRAGLLTGRYQQRAGIEAVIHPAGTHAEHRKGLQKSEITFAELLKDAGYATGLIGKWHLGYPHNSDDYHPQQHGFDEFIGYHSGNIDFVSHVGDHMKHDWWHGRTRTHEEGYATDLINRHAVDFIARHHGEAFCLYLPHLAIHNPLQARGDPVRRTEQEWKRWKAANPQESVEMFRGMTLPVDEGVGQIRRALEKHGIDRNTLILFFTDNGPTGEAPSGNPQWRGNKGSVYEGGHKVPFIAWWPGRIPPGTESDVPAITLDVMPTLLALAGVRPPADRPLDGVDLAPVLFEGKRLRERPLYWGSLGNDGRRSEAMRDGAWKLVVQHPGAAPGTWENRVLELFNLAADPSEKTNLAGREPERAAALHRRLQAWHAETLGSAPPQPGGWGR